MEQAVLCHFLVLRAGFTVVGVGINADSTTGNEDACYLDVLGFHQSDEVLHDDVDAVLVEAAMIAEREQIELEALAFHHSFVRQIVDADLGKVGLARYGAKSGKLGAVEAHPIVVFGMFVFKRLQNFGIVVLRNFALLSKSLESFLFSVFHIIRLHFPGIF